jgi:hypothetical protein
MAANYVLVDFENVQPDMSALAGTAHQVIVFFGAKQQTSRHHFDKFDSLFELGSNLRRVKVPYSGKNALDMHIAFEIGSIHEKDPGASFLILSKDHDFDPLIEYLKAKGVTILRSKDVGALAKQVPPAVPAMGAVPRKMKGAGAGRKAQPQKVPQPSRVSQPSRLPQPSRMPQPSKASHPSKVSQPPKVAQPSKPPQPSRPPEKNPPLDALEPVVKHLRSMRNKPATRKKLARTLASHFAQHGGARSEIEVEQVIFELIRRGFVAQDGAKVTYHLG